MFPPSAQPDRRAELVELTQQLARELQARGGTVLYLGWVPETGTAGAWIAAPDGTRLALTLSVGDK